jgi:MFS family permease
MSETASIVPQSMTKAKFAIFLTLFTAGIGNSFVFAILPPLGREIGLKEIQIGSIIATSATVFMFTAPLWGRKSETWGRKPVIMFAMVAYCITTLLFATAVQLSLSKAVPLLVGYALLLFFRCTFTAGISGMFPSSQAYMADITSPEERTSGMALVGMASGLGMIAGPGLAGAFAEYGMLIPFYVVAGLSVIAGLCVWAFIVEVPRDISHDEAPHVSLFTRELVPFFMISTMLMTTLSCMQQATGFYLQDTFDLSMEKTTQRVGVALMASALCSVSSQLIFVQRMRWMPKTLMRTGSPLILLGVLGFISTDNYMIMVAAMGCFGLGFGMMMPGNIASISMKVTGNQQGRVAGVNTSAQGMGFIIGPLIGSGLYQVHPHLPYLICALLASLAIAVVYRVAQIPDTNSHLSD